MLVKVGSCELRHDPHRATDPYLSHTGEYCLRSQERVLQAAKSNRTGTCYIIVRCHCLLILSRNPSSIGQNVVGKSQRLQIPELLINTIIMTSPEHQGASTCRQIDDFLNGLFRLTRKKYLVLLKGLYRWLAFYDSWHKGSGLWNRFQCRDAIKRKHVFIHAIVFISWLQSNWSQSTAHNT